MEGDKFERGTVFSDRFLQTSEAGKSGAEVGVYDCRFGMHG